MVKSLKSTVGWAIYIFLESLLESCKVLKSAFLESSAESCKFFHLCSARKSELSDFPSEQCAASDECDARCVREAAGGG